MRKVEDSHHQHLVNLNSKKVPFWQANAARTVPCIVTRSRGEGGDGRPWLDMAQMVPGEAIDVCWFSFTP